MSSVSVLLVARSRARWTLAWLSPPIPCTSATTCFRSASEATLFCVPWMAARNAGNSARFFADVLRFDIQDALWLWNDTTYQCPSGMSRRIVLLCPVEGRFRKSSNLKGQPSSRHSYAFFLPLDGRDLNPLSILLWYSWTAGRTDFPQAKLVTCLSNIRNHLRAIQ